MKILIITNHSYMLYQFRKELIEALTEDHEVVLSMPFVGHEEDFQEMGLKCIETCVDRRGINPKTDLKLFWFYRHMLRDEKPDMVVTYSIKPNIYAGIACKMAGIPFCVNVQGLGTAFQREPIATLVTTMYRFAIRKAKTVFFENKANAEEFVKRKIIPVNKETILNGAGVNLNKYPYQPYPDEKNEIHFLFVGRIMKEKGVDELFSAVRNIKKLYGEQIVFDIVGFFEDDYESVIKQMQQENLICFHGFQNDPRPYYAKSHCVVLPSYHEGMSNVLLEAAATGRALITTDIPGCREAVEDGKNGFLCHVADSKSLEKAILKFLSLDCNDRKKMGKDGREKVEIEFNRMDIVGKTISSMFNL